MDLKAALKQIQSKQLAPVYLVLGEQDFLINQLKKRVAEIIPKEERTMNYASYDMEDTSVENAINDALSVPFFGERRVVIINNPFFLTGDKKHTKIDHDVDSMINYLKHPMNTTILFIMAPYPKLDARKKVTKELKKVATVVDLTTFSERQIRMYVTAWCQKRSFEISHDALDLLISKTGGDLSSIMNELPKLLLYCQRTKVVDVMAVDQLVTNSLTQNVFDLVELVLKFKSTAAIELYHDLLASDNFPLQINAILISQFRLLMQVSILQRQGYSQGSLASELKVHPYRIKLAMRTVQMFTINQLQDAYLDLIEMEDQMKTGNQDEEILFEMFMIKFAQNNKKG